MVVDPWAAAIGAAAQVATAPPAGPSQAGGGSIGGAQFDNSGWNVTFGPNSGITASRTQPGNIGQALAGLTGNPLMLAALAVGALLVVKKMRKRS